MKVLITERCTFHRLAPAGEVAREWASGAQARPPARGRQDMQRRVPDVSKLERTSGSRPATPLEKIVADVVEFERNRGE